MKTVYFYYLLILSSVSIISSGCKISGEVPVDLLPKRSGKQINVASVDELQQAVINVKSHETILVADGVYKLQSPLMIENKENFTLRGASGDAAKVVFQGGGWEGGNPREAIVIRSSDDVVIADMTIADCRNFGVKIEALGNEAFPMSPKNIHIIRCNFMNIGVRAIKGTAPANRQPLVGGSVRFCRFENTKIPDTTWQFNGDYISAIDMMYLKDWVFSDNMFYNIRGAHGGGRGAIFLWNQSRNITVERNTFIGCDRGIAFGNPSEPTHYEPGTVHIYDGIIRDNCIVGGDTRGKGIEIVWVNNVEVRNNSIYSPDEQYRGIHYFQKISGLNIIDNIVRGRILGEDEATIEGNVTEVPGEYFVSPAVGDLRLTALAAGSSGKGARFSPQSKAKFSY